MANSNPRDVTSVLADLAENLAADVQHLTDALQQTKDELVRLRTLQDYSARRSAIHDFEHKRAELRRRYDAGSG